MPVSASKMVLRAARTSASVRTECLLSSGRRVRRVPMSGDVRARRNPDVVARADVLEEAREAGGAAGPSHDPAMEADREHAASVGPQLLERVDQVLGEVSRGDEAVREQELEVVGVER